MLFNKNNLLNRLAFVVFEGLLIGFASIHF